MIRIREGREREVGKQDREVGKRHFFRGFTVMSANRTPAIYQIPLDNLKFKF